MATRRDFLTKSALASAAVVAAPLASFADIGLDPAETHTKVKNEIMNKEIKFPSKFGIGGVGFGNGWHVNSNEQITETLAAAWNSGVRYYDTSPFYGLGLSERRLGHFLFEKKREEYLISTKVGRVFEADPSFKSDPASLWKGELNFKYKYDYSASGVRRSVEDSLQRLGLSSIDMVFVHDLSPDTKDLNGKWLEHFEIASKGAFPELTKMRDEGIIKGWGMGVNTPDPIMKSLDVADPDVMLVAIQYTLFDHKNALDNVFPAMQKKNVKAVIGGPLNAGFAAGRDRWNYGKEIPSERIEQRNKFNAIAKKHNVDLATVALQFAAAHPVVASVIPGASTAEQAQKNAASFAVKIPAALWQELKKEKLIEAGAPVPK